MNSRIMTIGNARHGPTIFIGRGLPFVPNVKQTNGIGDRPATLRYRINSFQADILAICIRKQDILLLKAHQPFGLVAADINNSDVKQRGNVLREVGTYSYTAKRRMSR
jgi:hypothetical protein